MTDNLKKVALTLAVIAIAAGCGKKNDKTAVVAPPPADAATAAPAPAAAAPVASPPPVVVTDVSKSLAESEAAIKAKSYQKAVQTILALQRQAALNPQQAQAAMNQMRALQAELAAGVAAGDPNAKAAVKLLTQSSMR